MARLSKKEDLIINECDTLDEMFTDPSRFDNETMSEYKRYKYFCDEYRFDSMKNDYKIEQEELNAFKFEARNGIHESFGSFLGYMIFGFAGFVAFLYSDLLAGFIEDRLAFLPYPWDIITFLLIISAVFMTIVFIIVLISHYVDRKAIAYNNARAMSRFIFQQKSIKEEIVEEEKNKPFTYDREKKRVSLPSDKTI